MTNSPVIEENTDLPPSGAATDMTTVIARAVAVRVMAIPVRWWLVAGLLVTVWMALWKNLSQVPYTPAEAEYQLQAHGDVYRIYTYASKATWGDIPKWFVGPWIYKGAGYYRPLTSVMFFLERRAFDRNFTAYNVISMAMHVLCAVLLYALVVSLLRSHPRVRVLCALTGVWFFATPASSTYFAVRSSINWWPAQNDPLALIFVLSSLILLDRYLLSPRKALLAASVAAMVCAIGAKEVGHFAMPMALALIYFRRRKLTREMLLFAIPSLFLFVFRRIVVPGHWEPNLWSVRAFERGANFMSGSVLLLLEAQLWWIVLVTALIMASVVVGIRRKIRVWKVAALCLTGSLIFAQMSGENGTWALLFDDHSLERIARTLIYATALCLFWKYRDQEPGALAAVWVVLASISIMGFAGYHYYYLPSAFMAIADGVFVACFARGMWEGAGVKERWAALAPRPVKQETIATQGTTFSA